MNSGLTTDGIEKRITQYLAGFEPTISLRVLLHTRVLYRCATTADLTKPER